MLLQVRQSVTGWEFSIVALSLIDYIEPRNDETSHSKTNM